MLGTVLSIDPGLRKCGCALWSPDGTLRRAWTAKVKGKGRGPAAWSKMVGAIYLSPDISVLVCEQMQVYREQRTNADDLLELTGVLGALSWRFRSSEMYGFKPGEWKGQVPKHVMQKRLEKRQTKEELDQVEKGCTHDAWDAIGIGAFYFRRQGIERWQLKR